MLTHLPPLRQMALEFREGRYTPRDVVEFCLAQIERWEQEIRAWVLVDTDGARQQADRFTEELRCGVDRGPLHGVPVGIKDLIDVAGFPTRAGSPLRSSQAAERDAEVVARLRAAGAIVLGKTVTTEWACFDPPPTRNPWNDAHTPGGSSSGSAAGVALEMCGAALGSQTGGSIIRPASFCGVAGLKPTWGAVSTTGVVPLAEHLDHVGPIARSADDLRLVFNAIVATPQRGGDLLGNTRWCVLDDFYSELADPAVITATQTALARLRECGLAVEMVELPASFRPVHAHHRTIMAYEAARHHGDLFRAHPESFGPKVAELLAHGLAITPSEYETARRHQEQLKQEWAARFPTNMIALTPSTTTPAPSTDTTGDPRFNSPWSYTGSPTLTIPCGLSDQGLPCGLQLVAAPHQEERLVMAASQCESLLAFQAKPPGTT